MVDEDVATGNDEGGLFPQRVGERLRAARKAAGLDLNDIAGKTRVPMRHLEAIERNDYGALPSITYAIGFARSFARAIGADEIATARDLRAELGRTPTEETGYTPYEPVDPARVPSRLLAWTAAVIAVVLLVGYLVWRSDWFNGDVQTALPALVTAPAPAPSARQATPTMPLPTGQVVLTAISPVWLRIYDKADKVLLQKQMAANETFDVPLEADTPMIRTGRPDALKVTIDGKDVARLGAPETMIRDVPINAKALLARVAPVATLAQTPEVKLKPTTFAPLRSDRPAPTETLPDPVATPAKSGNSAGQ